MEINSNHKRDDRDTIKQYTKVGVDKHAPWRTVPPLDTSHKTPAPPRSDEDYRTTVNFQNVYQWDVKVCMVYRLHLRNKKMCIYSVIDGKNSSSTKLQYLIEYYNNAKESFSTSILWVMLLLSRTNRIKIHKRH